ncbi:methyltransferase family protein [Sulfurimonas marina]|uniref:Isoprenylcysteine carboxylmethyltransferase family protein n=1 Tax=Sulfurimonas marina TaxID=2590551 RepID=A0A7M1AV53_9BACT|nr:isoprenylcysteine carboxylmethyltransferase family protein [Sulfurimonas marina]QOP41321.1 isoprenylcysteine carboxylmethyltransferase family protein [Sulfurimonas marina]
MINQESKIKFKPSQWFGVVTAYLLVPLILLVCGWDLYWWQAWVYLVLIVTAGIVSRILAEQRHPGILIERSKYFKASDVKPWDKLLGTLMALSISFPLAIVAGLDHRFSFSSPFPIWVNLLGFVLIAFGYAFASWALIENRFFSTFVRIQKDREHKVCKSGPYKIVRHPGYAGNLLALPGIVLALNSLWTLIPVLIALIITVIRTELEDKTLQKELQGYKEYVQQVRYKLFPGIY